MKGLELLLAVVLMLLVGYEPNVLADISFGPTTFTILGVSLLILAHRLREKIKKSE